VQLKKQFFFPLRVEFLLKTDSGYPKDTGVNKPWQPLRIPFAITPIGQLHQSLFLYILPTFFVFLGSYHFPDFPDSPVPTARAVARSLASEQSLQANVGNLEMNKLGCFVGFGQNLGKMLKATKKIASTVHISRFFIGSSSGMYGIRYLKVFEYVSVSWCATGPARESEV